MNRMDLPEPLVSIVIPTRNRHEYLKILIDVVLSGFGEEVQLVVHDNSDRAGGLDECRKKWASDPRFLYVHDPAPMSITENFERSVALATGQYVCMLGDDDGVTPSVVPLARWMQLNNVDAAVTPVPTYLWPGVDSKLDGSRHNGILRLRRYTSKIRMLTSKVSLDEVLADGATSLGTLPSVYQGVVARSALDRLAKETGSVFPGASPDMANAIGLSAVVDEFAYVSFPIVISGVCPRSAAAEGASHSHQGEVADRDFLEKSAAEKWPAEVPHYFSGPTLYAATVVAALQQTRRAELIGTIRWHRLYAACNVLTPDYRDRVTKFREAHSKKMSNMVVRLAEAQIWLRRGTHLLLNLTKRVTRGHVVNLPDIADAVQYIESRYGLFDPYLAVGKSGRNSRAGLPA